MMFVFANYASYRLPYGKLKVVIMEFIDLSLYEFSHRNVLACLKNTCASAPI